AAPGVVAARPGPAAVGAVRPVRRRGAAWRSRHVVRPWRAGGWAHSKPHAGNARARPGRARHRGRARRAARPARRPRAALAVLARRDGRIDLRLLAAELLA